MANKTVNDFSDLTSKFSESIKTWFRSEIKRHKKYEHFLLSVWAQKDGKVQAFPDEQMERYVKKKIEAVGGSWSHFQTLSQPKRSEKDGTITIKVRIMNGYFVPREYWDALRNECRTSA